MSPPRAFFFSKRSLMGWWLVFITEEKGAYNKPFVHHQDIKRMSVRRLGRSCGLLLSWPPVLPHSSLQQAHPDSSTGMLSVGLQQTLCIVSPGGADESKGDLSFILYTRAYFFFVYNIFPPPRKKKKKMITCPHKKKRGRVAISTTHLRVKWKNELKPPTT